MPYELTPLDAFSLVGCGASYVDSVFCGSNRCVLEDKVVGTILDVRDEHSMDNLVEKASGSDGLPVVVFYESFNPYRFRKKHGVFPVEYLVSRGLRGAVLVGLDVIASWEFGLLVENDLRVVYLPVDSGLRGGFLPLTDLVDRSVKVGVGSGFRDGRMGVCDFRGVVWSAVLNQCSVLRSWDACRGVLAGVVGGWEVYGLRSGVLEWVRKIEGERAFQILYRYARTGVWGLDAEPEGLSEEAPDDG